MSSPLLMLPFFLISILSLMSSTYSFTTDLESQNPSSNTSHAATHLSSLLSLPRANALPQPPDPFIIYDLAKPPRTRVEFTRYSHRIPVSTLSEALISCLFALAKRAVRDKGSAQFGDFYRFANDGVAIVVRNHHVPGAELTTEIMTDVLWTMWEFANRAVLCSATFTVQWDGKSACPFFCWIRQDFLWPWRL